MNKVIRTLTVLAVVVCLAALVQADPFGPRGRAYGHTLFGHYSFHLTPVVSFAPFYSGPGRDSGVLTAPRQDILRVGTFVADGKGKLTGHAIATTDDGATTVVVDYTFEGTYTQNPDGTGKIEITAVTVTDASCTPAQAAGECATFEGPEAYAFVLNRHGEEKTVSLIQTDNVGGGAKIFLTGQAGRR